MKSFIYIAIIGALFVSCTKAIEFKLPAVEQDVVVLGKIETGSVPVLFLSKTQGYFDETSSASIFGTYINGANVIMSDGTTDFPLTEICTSSIPDSLLPLVSDITGVPLQNLQFFDFCIYTSFDPQALGVEGKTYTLRIETDTDTITASTDLPLSVSLVNPRFEAIQNLDSLGFIWAVLNDPPVEGNNYRWFAQRINTFKYNYPPPYDNVKGTQKDAFQIAPLGSVFDDKFFNGLSFDLQYHRGEVGNLEGPDDVGLEAGYFKRGDTVVVKFTTINHQTFLHLRALENQASTNGSPFASPGNLPSSVQGGIGLWAGYGVSIDTVICL